MLGQGLNTLKPALLFGIRYGLSNKENDIKRLNGLLNVFPLLSLQEIKLNMEMAMIRFLINQLHSEASNCFHKTSSLTSIA